MARRQWLIDARERRGWTREQAAWKARMTVRLLTWLEIDDEIITAPSFIDRLKRLYRLTDEQYNSMVHEKHYIGRKRVKDDETEPD